MKIYGIYPGMVIQNNDPDKAGRVKVYVPGVTNTVYEGWNADVMDKHFNFIDDPDLIPIVEPLRDALPWAINASTIGVGGTNEKVAMGLASMPLERPSDEFVLAPPIDAFGFDDYAPGDYSGTEGGKYAIPNVASHVFVFFIAGDVNCPVFFAHNHGSAEWERIMGDHYPEAFESDGAGVLMNKEVINTNKHSLEFIDTDELEEIKLSHFNGSNIKIYNEGATEFIIGDKHILIDANRNITITLNDENDIGENRITHIGMDEEINIDGERTVVIGADDTLVIDGAWDVIVAGSATIHADGDVTVEAGGAATVHAGGELLIKSDTHIQLEAPTIDLN